MDHSVPLLTGLINLSLQDHLMICKMYILVKRLTKELSVSIGAKVMIISALASGHCLNSPPHTNLYICYRYFTIEVKSGSSIGATHLGGGACTTTILEWSFIHNTEQDSCFSLEIYSR